MITPGYDLRYLQAGVDHLQDFLLSDALYWYPGISSRSDEPEYPSMTLDGLLLAQIRLSGRSMTADEANQYQQLVGKIRKVKDHWLVAWEKKAARCFHTRLNMWRDFLEEYRLDHAAHASRYGYEVRLRTMITLLLDDLKTPEPAELEYLKGLDTLLKAIFKPGKFIWEVELVNSFPERKFWYLYGYLPEES